MEGSQQETRGVELVKEVTQLRAERNEFHKNVTAKEVASDGKEASRLQKVFAELQDYIFIYEPDLPVPEVATNAQAASNFYGDPNAQHP